ncbi:MAG: hypothetical protein J0L62_01360 [Bacteroidetes bacterium]|nr:hypothetical protein [Bacteroidota bacterium]
MHKKILIISPYFPPVNAADMQRVRMSLPGLIQAGWKPAILKVDERFVEISLDPLLLKSVPEDAEVISVSAFSPKWTRKFGLGAIALRSLPFFWLKGSGWIRKNKPELIFFSTTQFPVLILARYWKWRFGSKIVFDIQDPWYNPVLPENQRPKKYWFSQWINGTLEPAAMKAADGIMAVSEPYWQELRQRYNWLNQVPCLTLPFGGFEKDIEIARELPPEKTNPDHFLIRYVGRGGSDMLPAFSLFLKAVQTGLKQEPERFKKIRIELAGTSYAPAGQGLPSLKPLADELGLGDIVSENPDRMPYFQSLQFLLYSDLLLVPGSDDPRYTASKLYPYLLTRKTMMAIFRKESSVCGILNSVTPESLFSFSPDGDRDSDFEKIKQRLSFLISKKPLPFTDPGEKMKPYLAEEMARKMNLFFREVIKEKS